MAASNHEHRACFNMVACCESARPIRNGAPAEQAMIAEQGSIP
jgi:hypothetical protein